MASGYYTGQHRIKSHPIGGGGGGWWRNLQMELAFVYGVDGPDVAVEPQGQQWERKADCEVEEKEDKLETTGRTGDPCLSLTPVILVDTGDLQKTVPLPSKLHMLMAQGSEKLKREIPWELEPLSWQLNFSDKVNQRIISKGDTSCLWNVWLQCHCHRCLLWPILTQNHTGKGILGNSV